MTHADEECDGRDQADADLLVEHLEHLLARAALEQLAVHLEALDRLRAALRGAELERRVLCGVVLARLRQLQDDVLYL